MENDERKKIHEIISKKDDSKIDWMYKGHQPESNEYLLGRKVDKYIENVPEPTNEEKFGAAFTERIKVNIELDMAAKMREDPLFQIRKREEEAHRRILDNPVKMKQIQKIIKEQKEKHQKTKNKKRKKEKKSKSCDSDSDQSGDELVKTYLNIISKKHQNKSDGGKGHHHDDRRHSGYGLQKYQRDREEERSSRHESYSKSSHRQNNSTHNPENTSKYSYNSREKYSMSHSYHRHSNQKQRSQSRSPKYSRSRSPQASGKIKENEREKKLKEMMDNAKWRDNIRQKNMKRYEEECAEDERNAHKGSSSDFLNPMMSEHAAQSSVEERIKRNKYNIQRTKMQLDSNFTKR